MNKIYLFCYDSDMTMRSQPNPVRAFKTYEEAYNYGKLKYDIKDKYEYSFMKNWSIEEIPFSEE